MKWATVLAGAALSLAFANSTLARTVFVSAFNGPWSVGSNPSLTYGVGDNTGAVVLALETGATAITITYDSGFASAFSGAPPSVDVYGYVGGIFGSGSGLSGIGYSGQPFPTFSIDPTNTGNPLNLMSLVGAFTDSSGLVKGSPFACDGSVRTCDGSVRIFIPVGATRLSLGANDDIFADNYGGWNITVTGVTAGVPELSTWAMMLVGFGSVGFAGYRSRKALLTVA
ncbi:hypothetical protein [uncultured Rhodoblastus sp.]|uniref:hypothetical protein n=1 Tax=uncultured Rhodoblastus sp. TaxID=543037 RepID=UPI0025FDF284|nr:hypothetical protein [uncultured Rhodoblastus sp.]